MLQHNWAVIDETASVTTVYFFHDDGTTKNLSGYVFMSTDKEKFIAIVDSLAFDNLEQAERALVRNGFSQITSEDHPFAGYRPKGTVFDARATEPSIYSKEGYWLKE